MTTIKIEVLLNIAFSFSGVDKNYTIQNSTFAYSSGDSIMARDVDATIPPSITRLQGGEILENQSDKPVT